MWEGPGLHNAPIANRLDLLDRCIKPMASFKWARWPWQKFFAQSIDRTQRLMIGKCIDIPMTSGEDTAEYSNRRRRVCASWAAARGRWSHAWARSVTTWHDHVLRGHDQLAWNRPVLDWQGLNWLEERRQTYSLRRTGTRAGPGRPAVRWEEGAAEARNNF